MTELDAAAPEEPATEASEGRATEAPDAVPAGTPAVEADAVAGAGIESTTADLVPENPWVTDASDSAEATKTAEPADALNPSTEVPEEQPAIADIAETETESTAAIEAPDEPAPAESETDPSAPEPAAVEGPRTVGRFVADALRSAGVRYAFTVPGSRSSASSTPSRVPVSGSSRPAMKAPPRSWPRRTAS